MNIVKRAKEWLDEPKPDNGAPEPDEFEEVREIISGLLLEVKCLKIQVCDRGNSYQKAAAKVKSLRETMKEAADYLDTNNMTNIAHGSIFHQMFRDMSAE